VCATAENGSTIYENNYEPFGPSSDESGSEDYRYTGKPEDTTGLYYFGARYFDPDVGRFITRDTVFGEISDPQSQNRYVYCMNNPHKYTDPNGRFAIPAIIVSIAGGAAFGATLGGAVYCFTHLNEKDPTVFTKGLKNAMVYGAITGAVSGGAGYVVDLGVEVAKTFGTQASVESSKIAGTFLKQMATYGGAGLAYGVTEVVDEYDNTRTKETTRHNLKSKTRSTNVNNVVSNTIPPFTPIPEINKVIYKVISTVIIWSIDAAEYERSNNLNTNSISYSYDAESRRGIL
jgi:RHS repeat-associated protein